MNVHRKERREREGKKMMISEWETILEPARPRAALFDSFTKADRYQTINMAANCWKIKECQPGGGSPA